MSLKRQLMFIHVFFAVMGIGLLVALVLRATLGTKFEPQERKYAIPSGDLVMRLTDPATRVETVRECGRKRDRSAVPLLRGFCRDKSPEVRLACAWALGEIGDTEAVYALRVRLSDRDVAVREEAAKALGKLGTGGDGVALASLLNALEDKAIDVKRAAIGGVAGVPGIDATEALARALSGEMPLPIRMRAVEALSDREGQPASRLLGVALNDTEAVIRRAAIQALIPRRDTAAYSAAASALRDADEGVRTGALKAIEAMGQPVLPALTKVLPTTGSIVPIWLLPVIFQTFTIPSLSAPSAAPIQHTAIYLPLFENLAFPIILLFSLIDNISRRLCISQTFNVPSVRDIPEASNAPCGKNNKSMIWYASSIVRSRNFWPLVRFHT